MLDSSTNRSVKVFRGLQRRLMIELILDTGYVHAGFKRQYK